MMGGDVITAWQHGSAGSALVAEGRDVGSNRLLNLQALRFFAAFLVVIYHVSIHYNLNGGYFSFSYLKYIGYAGVDLFFVISGFIIDRSTNRYKGGKNDLSHYLFRRFFRIYPPYWIIVVLWILILFALDSTSVLTTVDWLKSTTLWPQPVGHHVIPVAWTLSYEIYFYTIYALCVFAPRWRVVVLSTFAFVTAVLSVAAASGVKLPYVLTFASNPLIFEFLFGVLVSRYVLFFRIRNWPALLIVGIAGFAIFGLLLMVNNVILAGPILNFLRVVTFGMLSAVVVAATVLMERDVRPLPFLVHGGNASYSLYLIHHLMITLIFYVWPIAGVFGPTSYGPGLASLIVVFGSIALSIAFYDRVEGPLLSFVKAQGRALSPRGMLGGVSVSISLVLSIIVLCNAAVSVYRSHFPPRFVPANWIVFKELGERGDDAALTDPDQHVETPPISIQATNDLTKVGSGYRVVGPDPFIMFNFSGDRPSGRDIPWLAFELKCHGGNDRPKIQLFWWGDAVGGPRSVNSALLVAYRDDLVVPMGAAPSWAAMKQISGFRIDIAHSKACKEIAILNLKFYSAS